MEKDIPTEGNGASELAEVVGGAGENKPVNEGDINEETMALAIVVADEQEVTTTLTVVTDEQQEGTMALTIASGDGEVIAASGGGGGGGEVVVVNSGGEMVVVNGGGGGEVVVISGGEVTVASGGGEVAIVSGGEVAVVSDGEVTVASSGREVTVASDNEKCRAKKRGRPRKEPKELMAMVEFSTRQKRARGRPKGTGKWQRLKAYLGPDNIGVTGSHFTPHVITVHKGENIAERMRSSTTSDSLCILSATGTVSIAELYASVPRPGILRYEGEFSIVTLNGSHTYTKKSGAKLCLMSVQLAYPDGRLFGGAVAGSLIAATPTQIVMATFKQNWGQRRSGFKSNVTVAATASPTLQGMRLVAIAEPVDGAIPNQSALAMPIV